MNPLDTPHDLNRNFFAYGKDTFDFINRPRINLSLQHTTVKGDINGKSVQLNKALQIAGDVLATQGHIVAKDCKRLNHLTAEKGSIKATRCEKLGEAKAKYSISLEKCPNVMSVVTRKGKIDIRNSNVLSKVIARDHVQLENSNLRQLSCEISATGSIIIKNCFIKFLYVNQAPPAQTARNNDDHGTSEIPAELLPENQKQFMKSKFDITLTNSKIEKVIFSTNTKGTVFLEGTSRVKTVLNGNMKFSPHARL